MVMMFTAAVRRHGLFMGTPLNTATLKLGDCSPTRVLPA
jgi:hypothetical protein